MDLFKMLEDPNNPGLWIKDPKLKYPRLGIFNGYIGNLEPIIREKLINVMTIWRSNPLVDKEPFPRNWAEAFRKRYLLIIPDLIDRTVERYPKLFPKSRR